MLRPAFGERDWVIPNERIKTGRSARKDPSRSGFAVKAASRTSVIQLSSMCHFAV
jgi:hypothetical protein